MNGKEEGESRHNETTTKARKQNFLGRVCSQWMENLERNKSCGNKPENVLTSEHITNFSAIPQEATILSSLLLITENQFFR